ncbi:IPT/TIG domain-containing protein [Streptomyces decoyicus]|uniref:IPT/TIG domain-containing protein n=1 Tax=Streptomyces decoyicus TaxID=249567 RepID=UPI0033E0E415
MSTNVQSLSQELLHTAALAGQTAPPAQAEQVSRAAGPARIFLAVTSIPVGNNPVGVAIAPNNKVYVSNFTSASVSVIQFDPTLTSIVPTQGPIAGGTVVTITGTNLTGASVDFGGNPATGVSVNATGRRSPPPLRPGRPVP